MAKKMNIIECDGFQIAASVEGYTECSYPIYYPANFLVYVELGSLSLEIEGKKHHIPQGEFVLIRKYTQGQFFKEKPENEKDFREHIFVLHDEFIKEVIRDFPIPEDYMPLTSPVIPLSASPILKGLMQSIEGYIKGQVKLDRDIIHLKTKEALIGLTKLKPELIHIFNDFSRQEKADLVNFIEHNYTNNISLENFAKLSGRSLSTFNREFRQAYNVTPRKWLRTKRLNLARQLMEQNKKKASEVYLEVGFEDLAHFSRSFKNQFGLNPSEIHAQV